MKLASILLLVLAAPAFAQDLGSADGATAAVEADPDAPTVGASLDHSEAYVGDRLALTITAVTRAGIVVSLPQKLELGKLELLDRDDAEATGRDIGDGRRSFRFLLYVAGYEVGPAEVPPIELSYANSRGQVRTVSTSPLTVHIRGLVDENAEIPDPQPARPPRSAMIEDRRMVLVAWALGGALALGLLATLVVRATRRRRRRITREFGPVVATRPPGEIAIERLTAIRARGEFGRDGYRPFAFETAEVLRAYLGARYGFDSLELTSTELLGELVRAAPHLAEPGAEVARFLERTDLIKFAKTGATEVEALELLDSAQALVLSTAPKLEVAAEMLAGPLRPPMASEAARGTSDDENGGS